MFELDVSASMDFLKSAMEVAFRPQIGMHVECFFSEVVSSLICCTQLPETRKQKLGDERCTLAVGLTTG
jgi:hypothetical protein